MRRMYGRLWPPLPFSVWSALWHRSSGAQGRHAVVAIRQGFSGLVQQPPGRCSLGLGAGCAFRWQAAIPWLPPQATVCGAMAAYAAGSVAARTCHSTQQRSSCAALPRHPHCWLPSRDKSLANSALPPRGPVIRARGRHRPPQSQQSIN